MSIQLQHNNFSGVSVIISLFNYENTIIQTLESLKFQTLRHNEIVIVDDCSTDSGLDLAKQWADENKDYFNSIAILQNKANQGLAITRNNAVSAAKGMYLFVLDADNILFNNCLDAHKYALENSPDYSFAYSLLERFGDECSIMNTLPWDKDILAKMNYIDAMTLIRRKDILAAGGYSKLGVMGWEDYELWLKFAELGMKGINLPNIYCKYRVHTSSMLRTHTNESARNLLLRKEIKSLHPWVKI